MEHASQVFQMLIPECAVSRKPACSAVTVCRKGPNRNRNAPLGYSILTFSNVRKLKEVFMRSWITFPHSSRSLFNRFTAYMVSPITLDTGTQIWGVVILKSHTMIRKLCSEWIAFQNLAYKQPELSFWLGLTRRLKVMPSAVDAIDSDTEYFWYRMFLLLAPKEMQQL